MGKSTKTKILDPKYKVRLNANTVITIKEKSKLKFWKEKYPQAEIID